MRPRRGLIKGQNFSRSAWRAETKLGPGVLIVGYGSRQEVCPIVGRDGLHPTGRLRPVHVSPLNGQTFSPPGASPTRCVRDRAAEPRADVAMIVTPAGQSAKGLHRFFHPADGLVFSLQHQTRVAVIRVNHPCWDFPRSPPRQLSEPVVSSDFEYDALTNHASQHRFQGPENCNSD